MSFEWVIPPEGAFGDLHDDYAKRIYEGIASLADAFAPQIEAWLKQNRTWTDRTGNLRQSLYAEVELALTEIVIALDYGLDYGLFIATMKQGQYDIIGPALDYWSIQFWNAVQALLR